MTTPTTLESKKKVFDKKFVGITQGSKRVWWVDNPDRIWNWIITNFQPKDEK